MLRWLLWQIPRYRGLHYVIYLYLGIIVIPAVFGVQYTPASLLTQFLVLDWFYYIMARKKIGS